MNETMQATFKRLRRFTDNLSRKVEAVLPEMEEILEGKSQLLPNCPSKEAAAELALRGVEKYLKEVNAAVADIRKALFPKPTKRSRG